MHFTAFKDFTRLEFTLFAFPFVLAGALLSLSSTPFTAEWIWIIPTFLMARISGMAFNQYIDREIDARNPRTENRVIPSGKVSVKEAQVVAWGGLLLFLLLCFQINLLTALLAPIAASLLFIYSYMKRIHASCHFVLGAIHLLGPVMAYTALTGSFSLSSLFLGGAAAALIVGNDIMYAIQDYAYDSNEGLFSIPSRYGVEKSKQISLLIHAFCPLMLLAAGLSGDLPPFYYFVVPFVTLILFYFHFNLAKKAEVNTCFFVCNVTISFSTLLFIGIGTWLVM